MAFEPFPSEAVEAFNDPGIFYVHENGKLRSPPGLDGSSRYSHGDLDSMLPQISPFVLVESYAVGQTCFSPRSLFEQTVNFVARRLERVESLVGFPDIVGKQLFQAAEEQAIFLSKHHRLQGLKLFVEAYGCEVLSSMTMEGSHLMLEEYLEEVMVFSHLTEMELAGCGLGEEHEIWPHLGNMPSLQRLGLSRNGMSDHVMQKMTTPLRLMNNGPRELRVLDLSGNPAITERIIRYLRVFTNLRALDVTGCCFSKHGIRELNRDMGLSQLDDAEAKVQGVDVFSHPVENVGWASGIIQSWIKEKSTRIRQGFRLPQRNPRTSKFYSSTGNQLGFLDVAPKAVISAVSFPAIRLYRDEDSERRRASSYMDDSPISSVDSALTPTLLSHGRGKPAKESGTVTSRVSQRMTSDSMPRLSRHFRGHSPMVGTTPSEDNSQRSLDLEADGWKSQMLQRKGSKVKLRKKRKRQGSTCEETDNRPPLGPEDQDLLQGYLDARVRDKQFNREHGRAGSKLIRAMDMDEW
ncbi:leucine-rich repeat-containing protein 42-like [Diadema antillarum]|uniref:leucine-rich repeat-containing protein 42-like n=1 Tax=Diadema antillarum TaxID=105358 RepID=UPI003A8B2AAB